MKTVMINVIEYDIYRFIVKISIKIYHSRTANRVLIPPINVNLIKWDLIVKSF